MKKLFRFLSIYSFFFFLFVGTVSGQKGQMFIPFGGVNYSRLLNTEEIYAVNQKNKIETVQTVDTYRPLLGIDYIYNFEDEFGFQTGLIYSGNGQKYSGYVSTPANSVDSNVSYTSRIYTNYLKVPLCFRFNSPIEIIRVQLSIFVGFQVGILTSVDGVVTSPSLPNAQIVNAPDLRKLISPVDFGFVSGVSINVKMAKQFYISANARFDRAFTDMEDKGYYTNMSTAEYQKVTKDLPTEYLYPLAVKKSTVPAKDDYFTRRATLNSTFGVYLGIGYFIKGTPSPKRELED